MILRLKILAIVIVSISWIWASIVVPEIMGLSINWTAHVTMVLLFIGFWINGEIITRIDFDPKPKPDTRQLLILMVHTLEEPNNKLYYDIDRFNTLFTDPYYRMGKYGLEFKYLKRDYRVKFVKMTQKEYDEAR